jgi:SMI1 / KNR4 family (SUKH-1)
MWSCDPSTVSNFDWAKTLAASDDGFGVGAPVEAASLEHAESVIQTALPPTLRALYQVTDGILDKPGEWYVVWPIARLISDNLAAYELERTLRCEYVAFGDDGTGNPFCVKRGGADAVYYWSPIEETATWLADSARGFWVGWVGQSLPPH